MLSVSARHIDYANTTTTPLTQTTDNKH